MTRRLRIAQVLPVYAESGINLLGGGERYVYQLAQTLQDYCDVTLITFGPRRSEGTTGRVRHRVIPARGGVLVNPMPRAVFPGMGQFDLVHTYQLQTIVSSLLCLWTRALRIPLLLTDLGGGGRNPMSRLKLYRLVSRFMSISEYSRRRLPKDVQNRSAVVRGGVDTRRLAYEGSPRIAQVLQVGRIMPHKGINYLIDAAGDGVEVVIAGTVVDRGYYDDLRKRSNGKRVRFLTDAPDAVIDSEYRRSTATVAASVYRDMYGAEWPNSELLGLTLLESMAVGTPVVCTAVGGMPEYVKDGETGFVVEPNSPASLRHAIDALLADPPRAQRMGRAGSDHVQQYAWEKVAQTLLSEYEGVMANGGAARN